MQVLLSLHKVVSSALRSLEQSTVMASQGTGWNTLWTCEVGTTSRDNLKRPKMTPGLLDIFSFVFKESKNASERLQRYN